MVSAGTRQFRGDPGAKTREQTKHDLNEIPARVDRVNVSGLLRTHDDYVSKAANRLFKAKTFQELMIEAVNAQNYLNELGVFKTVGVSIDISHSPNANDTDYEVTFKGRELSRIVGSVGTEVGQNEGSLRAEFAVPNILGRGESISIHGAYSSTKASDVSLKFWKSLFHTRFYENRPELSFSIFRNTQRMDLSLFQTTNIGVNSDFVFNTFLPVELMHSIQYEAAIRDLSLTAKTAPFKIRQHCGPRLASLVRYMMIYDKRDHPVFPTRGIMLKAVNEYCGLGGNVSYTSHVVHGEASVPLFDGFVAQVAGRVGLVRETKKTTSLPLSDLFYCGGPLTLRGFKYGHAGPVTDGIPMGAQTYWSAAFHLWAPLPFSRIFRGLANNFRTHLFYNFGNYNTFSTETMRSAAGLGIAFKLGDRARIEFNYCLPMRKYETDKVVNGFQFGIGYEFV